MKQLQHLNKGLPDGFDSEGALNQVAAPTVFSADVKAIPGNQQKPALKIHAPLHKTQMNSLETPDVPQWETLSGSLADFSFLTFFDR